MNNRFSFKPPWERAVLKVTLALLILVVLLLSSMPAGCGREKSTAEKVADSVDRFLDRVDTAVSKASRTFDSLARNLKEGGQLTEALIETTLDTLKAEGRKISELVKSAREEITGAASIKGTSGYRKYVEIQNQILDQAASLSKMVADATKQLTDAGDALLKGSAPDTSRLSRAAEEWSRNFDRIQKDIDSLLDQARSLKED